MPLDNSIKKLSSEIDINNVNLATFPEIKKDTQSTANMIFRFDRATLKHNQSKSFLSR